MSLVAIESLPSLARPLIVNPATEVVEDENEPLCRPPFPAIDLNWQGFIISHFPWVGIKSTNNIRRFKINLWHEWFHSELAFTPFLLLKKYKIFNLHNIIHKTYEEGKEQIEVPLDHKKSRNNLEKLWNLIFRMQRESILIEEIYAVRSSLLSARKKGVISPERHQSLELYYKEKYEKFISGSPGFVEVYNAFDFVASKLGEAAASGLVFAVFGKLNPTLAFFDLIYGMCKVGHRVATEFQWKLSDGNMAFLANLSFVQAAGSFTKILDGLDPDHSRYGRISLLEDIKLVKRKFNAVTQDTDSDFFNFVTGLPKSFLITPYSDFIYPFPMLKKGGGVAKEVKYGEFIIVLEAIMQQLITGIGLLCPYWVYDKHYNCCSRENRAFLEKVWSCTKPESSCKSWKRMGCLRNRRYSSFNVKT